MRKLPVKPAVFPGVAIVLFGIAILSASILLAPDRQEPDEKRGNHKDPLEEGRKASVMILNGEPVSREEFMHVLKGETASVFAEFSRKYGIASSKDFWYRRFDQKVPADVLKERVLEKIKRIKMEQILMKEHGIVEDISFRGFLAGMQAENARRKAALEKKLPIYGPIRYEAQAYYDVLHKNRLEILCNTLAAGELRPGSEDLEAYYAKNREKLPDASLEEISAVVRNRVVREKCDARITKSLGEAQWAVNRDVYASIRVE